MDKWYIKEIIVNFKIYRGIHKNISIIITAYAAIILYVFLYIDIKDRNIIDAFTSKQIEIQKSKTINEKQQRQYIIVIMFQQTGITLMLLAVPVAISLFQFSRLNIRCSKRKASIYPTIPKKENDFSKRLIAQYPNLTSNDIKLCELLKQNLTSKEIAIQLNISPASVNTARYRLRKKLGISVDQELLNFLHKL